MTQPNIAIVDSRFILRRDDESFSEFEQILNDNDLIEAGEHIEFADADTPDCIIISHRRVDHLAYNPAANLFDNVDADDYAYVIAEALLDCCECGSYVDIAVDDTVERVWHEDKHVYDETNE